MPESLLLTVFDVLMILSITIVVVALPALLIYRKFRTAGKTALAVVAGIAANAAVHTVASLLRF
jgi:hypothetical protein